MRQVIALFVIFSLCSYVGCGGGSGVKSPTKDQISQSARRQLQGDPDEGPSRAPARPARPGESSETAAADSKPATEPAGETKTAEANSTADSKSADAFDSPPATGDASAPAESTAKKAAPKVANPRFANLDEDADTPSAAPGDGNAAAKKPAPRVANPRFANLDEGEGEAPSTGGGKGQARPGARTGGGGIAGGKGAPRAAPADEEAAQPTEAESGPTTQLDAANKSFEKQKEFDAIQHLYAHLLVDDAALSEYPLHWVDSISEPRVFLRWGVGVVYTAPSSYTDRPPVIGDPVAAAAPTPAVRAARGGRAGGESKVLASSNSSSSRQTTQVDRSTPQGSLIYYTGDFGERLINRLDSRRLHKDYYYGKLLAEVKVVEQATEVSGGGARNNAVTDKSTTRRSILDAGDDERSSQTTRTNRGAPGRAAGTETTNVALSGSLLPGVIFLGAASESNAEKELLDRGKAAGVDAVLIFYVTVKTSGRSSAAVSTTSLGVHILKSGDTTKTGTLNNETVAKARERDNDSANDPVEVALDKIFNQYADEKLRFSAMPELKPEAVQGRVEALVAKGGDNPLPSVVEILSYHKSGLLDDVATIAAVGKLIGGEDAAKKLLSGTPEEKLAAIDKWLPGKFNDPTKSSSFR